MKNKITIVLVDDHEIVRRGLRTLLELEPDISVLAEAKNGLEAVQLVQTLDPMIVIMDLALPVLNGIDASRQILISHPSMKILILSAHCDDKQIEKLVSLEVMGILIKHCSPEFLVRAVRDIAKGMKFYSKSVRARIPLIHKKVSFPLSARETQVLQLIAEGRANKQVADILKISIKTVEKHRQSLMNKLTIHDTAGLTRYAISEGMVELKNALF